MVLDDVIIEEGRVVEVKEYNSQSMVGDTV